MILSKLDLTNCKLHKIVPRFVEITFAPVLSFRNEIECIRRTTLHSQRLANKNCSCFKARFFDKVTFLILDFANK